MESATILISQTFRLLKKALSLQGYVAISYEKRKKVLFTYTYAAIDIDIQHAGRKFKS